MIPVGILISGRGSNMRALVQQASGYRVVLVASDRPDAAGLEWARAHGLATFALSPKGIGKAAFEGAIDDALREAGVEVIALAGYMRLLSDAFVAHWRGRVVNIHPSLLPRYKGLDTHARAIAAGDTMAGCSVHLVTEELDGGRVLGQAEVPILPGDDAGTLAERVLAAEHCLYPATLAEFVTDMTDVPERLRTAALALPETEETTTDEATSFLVAGEAFARWEPGIRRLDVRDDKGWRSIDLAEPDWALVEDRIAASWELTAPRRLLEAGGR